MLIITQTTHEGKWQLPRDISEQVSFGKLTNETLGGRGFEQNKENFLHLRFYSIFLPPIDSTKMEIVNVISIYI